MKIRNRVAAALAAVSLAVAGGGAAYAATAGDGHQFQQVACVKYGVAGSAAGNVMEYDYNDSACPAGTYRVDLANPQPAATATVTVTATPTGSLSSSPSGSASSTATGTPAS